MFHFRATALISGALVTTLCLTGVPSANAAGTPGDQCAQAIAKSLSKGVKKVLGAHSKCYKGTGSDCAPGDSTVSDALADVQGGIQDKCTNTSIVDAGYGGYASGAANPTLELAKYFKGVCEERVQLVLNETFGSGGSAYTAADADGKKCILTAAKEAGKYYSGALKSIGKCVPDRLQLRLQLRSASSTSTRKSSRSSTTRPSATSPR